MTQNELHWLAEIACREVDGGLNAHSLFILQHGYDYIELRRVTSEHTHDMYGRSWKYIYVLTPNGYRAAHESGLLAAWDALADEMGSYSSEAERAWDDKVQADLEAFERQWDETHPDADPTSLSGEYRDPAIADDEQAEEDNQPCEICGADDAHLYENYYLCPDCTEKATAYGNRVQARYERLQRAADNMAVSGKADVDRAAERASYIPFGQPILVGHYSEKRDRAYREKIENGFRRGYAKMDEAKELGRRADAARDNTAISSDDPQAILRLREKLTALEAKQEQMKTHNAAVRQVMKLPEIERVAALSQRLNVAEEIAAQLLQPDFLGRIGYADYRLRNNNAEIRRVKQRIAALTRRQAKAQANPEGKRTTIGEVVIEENMQENRLRLHFPGKPTPRIIAMLKGSGWRWSPSNMAWQRHLSNQARYQAELIAKEAAGQTT